MSLTKRAAPQKGVTLIELMIGLTVGLIVITVIGSIFLSILRTSSATMHSLTVNQEMRSVMALMVSDLRRAGYWEGAVDAAGNDAFENPFTTRAEPTPTPTGTNLRDVHIHDTDTDGLGDCIMYSYDLDHDDNAQLFDEQGVAPRMGFRLDGGSVQGLVTGVSMGAGADSSSCGGPFKRFTDDRVLVVDSLEFSTAGSRCVNVDQDLDWVLPADSIVPACHSSAPGYTANEDDRLVEVRNIRIRMEGHHANDDEMVMDLETDVLIRNNRMLIAE